MSDYGTSRKNQYFVPGEGIAREVITADICKYLDNDATVRPMNYQGRDGFMLYAYRNLTSAMIEDLKKDTVLWEREQRDRKPRQSSHRGAAPGTHQSSRKRGHEPSPDYDNLAYVDSKTHERRQIQGPSVPETPSPGLADGYPPGRQPPMGYPPHQQPSPQHEGSFPGPRGPAGGYPSNSSSPSFNPGYPATDPGYQQRPSQEYSGFPPDSGFGGSSYGGQASMGGPGRGIPQPPQTAPPGPQRDPRDPRFDFVDHRNDPRGMPPPGDPRQFPPGDRPMDYPRHPVDPRGGYDARGYQDGRYRR